MTIKLGRIWKLFEQQPVNLPPRVVERISGYKQLLNKGLTLEEIKFLLGNDPTLLESKVCPFHSYDPQNDKYKKEEKEKRA